MKYLSQSIELISSYLKIVPVMEREEARKYLIRNYSIDSKENVLRLKDEIRALLSIPYLREEKSLEELLEELEKTLNE